ncbi:MULTISPECIES: manganese efflux pump MntP family protein [Clostridium]|uniref:Putative manganese efflux pump MntP n=1 Tax=Clostridium cibarium TaxID=2762247 RepID=A0ABR8PXM0_9CLOT|nr:MULTISPECIES: manganese efflux pump MntP family protein [Clostridium]MBD7912928.1 manganese efflux pump [Clostridium cibarium]
MSLISIILIGIGLSMDAFAVSITAGINTSNNEKRKIALKSGLFFGIFQGLMPLLGWAMGIKFSEYIEKVDHWIAFILLSVIGGKMLIEALRGGDEEENTGDSRDYTNKRFLILAIATSIDALAVGISFAFLNVNILSAIIIIAAITFVLCIVAVYLGKIIGDIFRTRAEVLGGIILILIGVKILLEHLFK